MPEEDLFSDLKSFIEEIKEEDLSDLRSNSPLLEGLLDSFDLVQLITNIEDKFNIYLSTEDLKEENFYSIKTIMNLIQNMSK